LLGYTAQYSPEIFIVGELEEKMMRRISSQVRSVRVKSLSSKNYGRFSILFPFNHRREYKEKMEHFKFAIQVFQTSLDSESNEMNEIGTRVSMQVYGILFLKRLRFQTLTVPTVLFIEIAVALSQFAVFTLAAT